MVYMKHTVLITGGAGYVGSALVPALLREGYAVKVLDLYLYGKEVLEGVRGHPDLEEIEGDIRDQRLLREVLPGCNSIIHLACISNDPSFELDPALGKSINLDAFRPLVEIAKESGVKRFVYASSPSVYGVQDVPEVTEESPVAPITDYARFKADCEVILREYASPDFTIVTLRPATVCGYAPRQRLDVIVNILTNQAVHNRVIKVFGGSQKRPNIHIADVVDAYLFMLSLPTEKIANKIYNVGRDNQTVLELAHMVKDIVGPDVRLEMVPTPDHRSYHMSSALIERELGFHCKRSIADAVRDLVSAFQQGLLPNSLTDSRYFNIKRMQEVHLH